MPDRRPNKWLSLLVWLLPSSRFKLWALRLLGNDIGNGVVLGPSLVLNCGRFSIADGAGIMNFNSFRQLSSVDIGPRGFIGNWNQITAAAEYQQYSPLVGKLKIAESAVITNRHYVDCSGQVVIEAFGGIGGVRCIVQSHSIDPYANTTAPGRVVVGRNAMALTGCILLTDSYIPERSVLAAGSVLIRAKKPEELPTEGLYGGSPAKFVRKIEGSQWWDREVNHTAATPFDDAKFRLE